MMLAGQSEPFMLLVLSRSDNCSSLQIHFPISCLSKLLCILFSAPTFKNTGQMVSLPSSKIFNGLPRSIEQGFISSAWLSRPSMLDGKLLPCLNPHYIPAATEAFFTRIISPPLCLCWKCSFCLACSPPLSPPFSTYRN